MKQKRIKEILERKNGFTLIELIVSFALTAILMTAATMVMSSFMRVYTWCNASIHMRQVANILMETITSQLGASEEDPVAIDIDPQISILLTNPNQDGSAYQKAAFKDKNGNNSQMALGKIFINEDQSAGGNIQNTGKVTLENQYLVIRYIQYKWDEQGKPTGDQAQITNWQYPKETYMGNEIESLLFRLADPGNPNRNLIEVELVLKNTKTGLEYTYKRIVECYNANKIAGSTGP